MIDFIKFCGSEFWNTSKTWDTEHPTFTECFQDTVLIWVPCAFLWLCLPFYACYLSPRSEWYIPATGLNRSKIFICLLMLAAVITDIVRFAILYKNGDSLEDGKEVTQAKLVSSSILAGTLLVSCILMRLLRARGRISSGVLWLFWLFLLLAGIIPFYINIKNWKDKDTFSIVTFFSYYGLLLIQFILSFKSDMPANIPSNNKMSPELFSSFASYFTYWWVNKLLLTGYRRDLSKDDIWDLNPRDTTQKVSRRFENHWNSVLNSFRKRQANLRHHVDITEESVDTEKTPLLSNKIENKVKARLSSSSSSFEKMSRDIKDTGGSSSDSNKEKGAKKSTKSDRPSPSILKVLMQCFGWRLLLAQLLTLVYTLLVFVSPLLQSQLIDFVTPKVEGKAEEWKGYLYAVGFFLTSLLKSIFFHLSFHISMTMGMQVKAVLISAVYKKSLTMNNESRKDSTVGETVNLMSVDCTRIQDVVGYVYMIWSSPLQIAISLYMLYNVLGPSIFAGVGAMLLLFPLNGILMMKMRKYQIEQLTLKDERIKLMNEVLSGIKVLKLYAWETSFQKKVNELRRRELYTIKMFNYMAAAGSFVWYMAPFLVTFATFATYILSSSDNILDAQKAFVSLSLFNILQFPINMLPMVVTMFIQAGVSLTRLARFLSQEDLDLSCVQRNPRAKEAVLVQDSTFSWEKDGRIILRNIDMKIPEGSLTAVVGQVGVGKSSLISAILGEMYKIEGRVNVKGSTAYVPQQAWIQNSSVEDNITFGLNMDKEQYDNIVEACALKPDLEILPAGDQTEIGEKGINLSGGQKQRVSLARAVYNDADIYYLDDPLSAVDSHVGKHIFDKVIGPEGLLRKKTRILVTHGIQWLPHVDHILVLNNGRISEAGSYEELLDHNGAFAQFLKTHFIKEESSDEEDEEFAEIKSRILQRVESVISEDPESDPEEVKILRRRQSSTVSRQESLKEVIERSFEPKKPQDGATDKPNLDGKERLTEDETANTGKVQFSVLVSYIRAVGSWFSAFVVLMFMLYQATSVFSNIWLTQWTGDPYLLNETHVNTAKYKDKQTLYLSVYGASGVVQVIFVFVYGMLLAIGVVRASTKLHAVLLYQILRCPMSFFDTTPSGRILNRFSSDIDTVDRLLPMSIRQFILFALVVLSTLFIISYTSQYFIALIVPLAILYYLIQRFYIATSRQLKRIESVTRSPIFTHFSETISGSSSIRAYGQMDRFIVESERRVDHNNMFYFAGLAANRWLGFRLEFLGSLVIFSTAIFAVVARSSNVDAGLVGLSISYALQITISLNFLTRQISELERNLVAVERILEYSAKPSEALWYDENTKPPSQWPSKGEIHLKEYSTRYREGLDLVLKGITCHIKSGEKVGVVGRTGAGKSSLTLALFRLIESAGGSIIIDGINVETLGLHQLRGKLTILPQDPVLFSGTLRMNIDPLEEYDDDVLWEALEHAHLRDFIVSLPEGLEYEVGEGGQSLSVGQRQLVCLARSLLHKSKILILDEATAAVDLETDDLIQNTIRTEFADCTVITIAHRLNTIMDNDRIMVLASGEIKEYDTPASLLSNKDGLFYNMAHSAGLV